MTAIKMITERTYEALMEARFAENIKSIAPDDSHPAFDAAQQALTAKYKKAFGCEAATNTFKAATTKKGERKIYTPCVMAKDGVRCIQWGSQSFPIPAEATFEGSDCTISVVVDEVEYSLPVRTVYIESAEKAKGKVQETWFALKKEEKPKELNKLWRNGNIVELLAQPFDTIYKISEVVGVHDVIDFKMGDYEKYVVQLADKRWVRANVAIQTKLEDYKDAGVIVSHEQPARLTVGESTSKTALGHNIYPTKLVSFKNINIPVYDFGFGSFTDEGEQKPVENVMASDTHIPF